MISGLYSAATAMDAAAMRHETAAENLANAHMPGFRRRVVSQTPFDASLAQAQDKLSMSPFLGTTMGSYSEDAVKLDFTQGPMQQTQRTLDVALNGAGFFVVEGPTGPLYTRNGAFMLNGDGELVTVDQLPVRGIEGRIFVPPDTSSEAITIDNEGRLLADGVEFGQLETVQFADRNLLNPVGASLFQAPADVTPENSEDVVLQGYLEQGNVAHMDELVNILVASRQYEAAQRVLDSIDESVEKHINN